MPVSHCRFLKNGACPMSRYALALGFSDGMFVKCRPRLKVSKMTLLINFFKISESAALHYIFFPDGFIKKCLLKYFEHNKNKTS
jgi:hypothetical protein